MKGACCNDCECERCEGTAEAAPVPIPPPDPCPDPLGVAPTSVGADPASASPLWLSLVVVCGSRPVELLESDSRGGCSVCCDSVSLGVQIPPDPLRESIGTAETWECEAWPVVVPVKIDMSEGLCCDLWASAALVAAGVSLFFCSELSRSVETET